MKQMSIDHWRYIKTVLEEHGENKEIIEKCGFHYRTAFEHGFKHGVESTEVAQRDQMISEFNLLVNTGKKDD